MENREDAEDKIEVLKRQAELCKSLSDPKRLQIIQQIRDGEKTVSQLAEVLGLKQSNTSQHLALLRTVGLISPRKDGRTVYYRLVSPKIAEACDLVHEVIAEQLLISQRISKMMQKQEKIH
ncbi:ArsR/SmtB family transcription factor [Chloroflexota bacterium]